MKKKIKKLNEKDYLKSISNIVDLFYDNRRLRKNITKALDKIEELYKWGMLDFTDITEIEKILKGEEK